ncbi:MAG TPA: SDR family NAD(P)-dependent oxidoreductase [Ramlibacter sp.]|nr:SDR family NAD(P)-dependent oxidoreductase [Ramlibacter sp.]
MRYEFEGRVALVTGAGGRRGIGRATALRLAREGADVALMDLAWPVSQRAQDEQQAWDGVASVAREIEALGRRALPLAADVTDGQQVEKAVQATLEKFGRIDFLVANAAARPGGDRAALVDMPEEEFRRVLSVNTVGTMLCCKAVGRHMAQARRGSIVIVASHSARIGRANLAAYAASKFAQIGMMQSLAHEMAPLGVRVNAACPGLVDTARLDFSARTAGNGPDADQAREKILANALQAIPLGRVATADDVAGPIAFLCSDDARHITGQQLGIDGGQRM